MLHKPASLTSWALPPWHKWQQLAYNNNLVIAIINAFLILFHNLVELTCIRCVSSGSRSMTNRQFLETTFLKTDRECCFHFLSIMMLNLINIKLETEITLFLNNLCNMLSGRDILGQVFKNHPPFINMWCLYLHFWSITPNIHTPRY